MVSLSFFQAEAVSSEVQSELSGLGVSVYNQQEFEAGVLQQIDSEVQRRNAEQDRQFLLKEYSTVKREIESVLEPPPPQSAHFLFVCCLFVCCLFSVVL